MIFLDVGLVGLQSLCLSYDKRRLWSSIFNVVYLLFMHQVKLWCYKALMGIVEKFLCRYFKITKAIISYLSCVTRPQLIWITLIGKHTYFLWFFKIAKSGVSNISIVTNLVLVFSKGINCGVSLRVLLNKPYFRLYVRGLRHRRIIDIFVWYLDF